MAQTEDEKRYRLAVVDDHPVIRDGLTLMLESDKRLQVHIFVNDGVELFLEEKLQQCDLVILDISMPGMNGIDAARRLISERPRLPVLIFTMHENFDFVHECIGLGVKGYVLKRDPPEILLNAIHNVLEGKLGITPAISPMMSTENSKHRYKELYGRLQAVLDKLTERERDVLTCVASELSGKQISKKLGIKINTVNKHRENIRAKLGADKFTDLILYVRSFHMR